MVKPGTFNRILGQAKGTPHEAVMNDVVLRSQAQAIYDPANIGHFGLNLAKYAHFTSPIRRYADLIVHRALIRAFSLGDDGLTDREMATLGTTAEHITMTERRAMAAERDSTDRYVAAFMEDRIGADFRRPRHRRHPLRAVRAAGGIRRRGPDPHPQPGRGLLPP